MHQCTMSLQFTGPCRVPWSYGANYLRSVTKETGQGGQGGRLLKVIAQDPPASKLTSCGPLYKSEWMAFFMQPLEGRGLYHIEMAKLDASSCARAPRQKASSLPMRLLNQARVAHVESQCCQWCIEFPRAPREIAAEELQPYRSPGQHVSRKASLPCAAGSLH